MQRVWRGVQARLNFDDLISKQLEELEELERLEEEAAVALQSAFRG